MFRVYSISRHLLSLSRSYYIETPAKLYSSKQLKSELPKTNLSKENNTKPQEQESSPDCKVDEATIQLLERLSLVNFGSEKSKLVLQDAIKFADKIHDVNTDGVEPLVNVLEEEFSTPLREDVVNMENSMEDIMMNAKVVEEDYFVAPPSNVPLYQSTDEDKDHKDGK